MRRLHTKMTSPIFLLTFISGLGSAVVAGIFFAFSAFIMRALARLSSAQGITAMQSINVAVINRWFFAAFFGTAACCLVLAILCFFRSPKPISIYLLVGSLLYLLGTILVTIIFNVPLNNSLAAVDRRVPILVTFGRTTSRVGRRGIMSGQPQPWQPQLHLASRSVTPTRRQL